MSEISPEERQVLAESLAEALRASGEAEQASGAKDLLLANVSHEVRTPLTGLLGNLELLHDTELDPVGLHLHGGIDRLHAGVRLERPTVFGSHTRRRRQCRNQTLCRSSRDCHEGPTTAESLVRCRPNGSSSACLVRC